MTKPFETNHASPIRTALRLAVPLIVALASACQTNEDVAPEPDAEAPRVADPGEPCVQYCEARASTFMERCMLDEDDQAVCEEAWSVAFDSCVARQCSLVVTVPDTAGLDALAADLGVTLLGPEFEVDDVQPHYYDMDEVGSRVYTFTSAEDGARAFIEVGTTLDQPPLVSHGFGEVAAEALDDRAVEKIAEAYGVTGLELTRRYLSAAHPVLEYRDDTGAPYFYSVPIDDVSDVFGIEDDPDADQTALAIRRQGFVLEWSRHL